MKRNTCENTPTDRNNASVLEAFVIYYNINEMETSAPEGVYRWADPNTPNPDARLIVFIDTLSDKRAILFVDWRIIEAIDLQSYNPSPLFVRMKGEKFYYDVK